MKGSPCPQCGGQVMPYRRYATYLRPTTSCDECGAPVTQGLYYWSSMVGAAVFLLLPAVVIFRMETTAGVTPLAALLALLVLGGVGLLLDLAGYRYAPWRPVEKVRQLP